MHSRIESHPSTFGGNWSPRSAALAILIMLLFLIFVLMFMMFTAQPVQAQTYRVIHSFTGGLDGATPYAGLTIDQAGNLYGTAAYGGYTGGCIQVGGCGTVFKLSSRGSGWVFAPLYVFRGGSDGGVPGARVIIGPDGSLYGTTNGGGKGYGTVFNLKPAASLSPNILGGWTETVLYQFLGWDAGLDDGQYPQAEVVFDELGNLYGTTTSGGGLYCGEGCGTVYKLAPSTGGWTETVIKAFSGGQDGAIPVCGMILDQSSNLYGTTAFGGDLSCNASCCPPGCGVVFQLAPSGSGWNENVLHTFHDTGDGTSPESGLIFDSSGNLYGTTSAWVTETGGTVFEWKSYYRSVYTLYSLTGSIGPLGSLIMDGDGNLYGTTYGDGGYGRGSVFKLTLSNGGWTYTSLHDFTGGDDGEYPVSNVTFDTKGNLYGTASAGGLAGSCGGGGCGVVWEITP